MMKCLCYCTTCNRAYWLWVKFADLASDPVDTGFLCISCKGTIFAVPRADFKRWFDS